MAQANTTGAGACPERRAGRLWRLALIGALAGLFSAVFGVGGGIIMVPMLVTMLAYDTKVATATSLAAIIVIAGVGVAAHGVLGNVDWGRAALIGLPAMGGLLVGLRVKERVSSRGLTLAFAVVLVGAAVALVVT